MNSSCVGNPVSRRLHSSAMNTREIVDSAARPEA